MLYIQSIFEHLHQTTVLSEISFFVNLKNVIGLRQKLLERICLKYITFSKK